MDLEISRKLVAGVIVVYYLQFKSLCVLTPTKKIIATVKSCDRISFARTLLVLVKTGK